MNYSLSALIDNPASPVTGAEPVFGRHHRDGALMPITTRPEPVMVRGAGSYLWDDAGKQYLDFIQGWAVNALGHCPPEIVATLSAQAATLISPSPALDNGPQLALATLLTTASGLDQVHFSNSGAEANEVAVKLARKWGRLNKPGASTIVTTTGGFHGRTLAMMAASGKPGWDELFPPKVPGFKKVAFGDLPAMRDAVDAQTLAIMVEPIQGEAGVIVPPAGYLRGLRKIADDCDALLILDEVQTGIGRTGTMFGCEHEGVRPDVLTLGKGLGGGVPISATLAAEHVCCFVPGDQGGTYNGSPLMTAVGLTVASTVGAPEFLASVVKKAAHFNNGLETLAARHGFREVRGSGLLCAVRLAGEDGAAVAARAFERGLLVNAPRPDTLRFMPSLRVSLSEIDEAVALLDEVLLELA